MDLVNKPAHTGSQLVNDFQNLIEFLNYDL